MGTNGSESSALLLRVDGGLYFVGLIELKSPRRPVDESDGSELIRLRVILRNPSRPDAPDAPERSTDDVMEMCPVEVVDLFGSEASLE